MIMNRPEFQEMWAMHDAGSFVGEVIAFNFSNQNLFKSEAELQESNAVIYYQDGLGTQFYNQVAELKKSAEFGFDRFTKDEQVAYYVKKSQKYIREVDDEYAKFNTKDLSKENLLNLLIKYLDVYNNVYTLYHAGQPQYFNKIEEYLKTNIEKSYPRDRAVEIYNTLSSSDDIDVIKIEELEWLSIVKEAQDQVGKNYSFTQENISQFVDLKKKIEKHSENYIFLGTVEAYVPWNFDHYLNLLNKEISSDIDSKIAEIIDSKERVRSEKQKIVAEGKISNELSVIANNMGLLGNNRLATRFSWSKASHMYIEVMHEIAKRNNINQKAIWDYRLEEVKSLLLSGEKLSDTEFKKRRKSYLFYTKDGEINFYFGEDAIEMKKELISEEFKDIKEFKGNIACKGKITGRVIRFSWIEEELAKKMEQMNQGDILVAGQTRPFLMPAIKKAGAIITDEGGITCHAAIVSRELNIPCIIGTKIATKVLKDGDMVEVDADHGIVRILK